MARNNRAVGVEYVNDTVLRPDADQQVHSVRATRLVVVSAGAFGSPAILERSGIGEKSVLEKNSIQQIQDLPGVGENYQGEKLLHLLNPLSPKYRLHRSFVLFDIRIDVSSRALPV
jgi:choline dehydrogenase-like flavoprotein